GRGGRRGHDPLRTPEGGRLGRGGSGKRRGRLRLRKVGADLSPGAGTARSFERSGGGPTAWPARRDRRAGRRAPAGAEPSPRTPLAGAGEQTTRAGSATRRSRNGESPVRCVGPRARTGAPAAGGAGAQRAHS